MAQLERDLSSPYYFQYLALQLVERRSNKKRDIQSRRRNKIIQIKESSSDQNPSLSTQNQYVPRNSSSQSNKDTLLTKVNRDPLQIYDQLLSEGSSEDEFVYEYPVVPTQSKSKQPHPVVSSPARSSPILISRSSPTPIYTSNSGNSSPTYHLYQTQPHQQNHHILSSPTTVPQDIQYTAVPYYCPSPNSNFNNSSSVSSSPVVSPKHNFSTPSLPSNNNFYNSLMYNSQQSPSYKQ